MCISLCVCVCNKGVAVRRQRGGPALLQDCTHRARPQTLHGQPDSPRASERSEGGRRLDGPIQEPRLHGLERSTTGKHYVCVPVCVCVLAV